MTIANIGESAWGLKVTGTTNPVTYASTGGNTLVAAIQHQSATITSVTDSAGNTWLKAADTADQSATSQRLVAIYYCIGAAAVSTVTLNVGTSGTSRIIVYELTGVTGLRAGAAVASTSTHPPAAAPAGVLNTDYVIGVLGYNELSTGARLDTLDSGTGYVELDATDGGLLPLTTVAASLRTLDGDSGPRWTLSSGSTGQAAAAFYATVPAMTFTKTVTVG